MSYEEQRLWLFVHSGDACTTCEAMDGVYSYAVERPHPHCNCTITVGRSKSERIAIREELVDFYELAKDVGHIPKNSEISVERGRSTGTESTKVEGRTYTEAPIGINESDSKTETESSSETNKVTFKYDPNEGGDSQMVVATYSVSIYQTIETWRSHWSEGMGMDFEYEVFAGMRETRTFTGYHQKGF